MTASSVRTSTRWMLWLLALGLVAVFASLGRWQYQRGAVKEQFLAAWQQALQAPSAPMPSYEEAVTVPQPIDDQLTPHDGFRWLLLDNQRRGDAVGVRAYGLVRAANGSETAWLVDFGWLPFQEQRRLPELPAPPTAFHARGLLLPWPGQGIQLADNPWNSADAPLLLATLEVEEVRAAFGLPSLPEQILQLGPDSEFGFDRELRPLPNTLPAEKHYGYALQWFGLAATVLVVAVVLTLRSRR